MALSVALSSQHRIGLFSLDMNKHQVTQWLLAMATGIDLYRLRTGLMSNDEWKRVRTTATTLSKTKVWIDDRNMLSALQLRQRAQQLVEWYDVALLMIDNIHLIQLSSMNQHPAHGIPSNPEISSHLKSLARQLRVPVIVLAPTHSAPTNYRSACVSPPDTYMYHRESIADYALFLSRDEFSQPIAKDKGNLMITIRIINHLNGLVTKLDASLRTYSPPLSDSEQISTPLHLEEKAS